MEFTENDLREIERERDLPPDEPDYDFINHRDEDEDDEDAGD